MIQIIIGNTPIDLSRVNYPIKDKFELDDTMKGYDITIKSEEEIRLEKLQSERDQKINNILDNN